VGWLRFGPSPNRAFSLDDHPGLYLLVGQS
jgi:hypothetical protein